MFVKGSPRPSAISPTGTLSMTDAFRWTPSPFAVSYDVEAYKQGGHDRVPRQQGHRRARERGRPRPAHPAARRDRLRVAGPRRRRQRQPGRVERLGDLPHPGRRTRSSSSPSRRGRCRPPTASTPGVPSRARRRTSSRDASSPAPSRRPCRPLPWRGRRRPRSLPARGSGGSPPLDAGGAAIASSAWRDVTVQGRAHRDLDAGGDRVGLGGRAVARQQPHLGRARRRRDLPVAAQRQPRSPAPPGSTTRCVTADVGKSISLRVTGTLAGYDPATAVSNAVTGVLGATTHRRDSPDHRRHRPGGDDAQRHPAGVGPDRASRRRTAGCATAWPRARAR